MLFFFCTVKDDEQVSVENKIDDTALNDNINGISNVTASELTLTSKQSGFLCCH